MTFQVAHNTPGKDVGLAEGVVVVDGVQSGLTLICNLEYGYLAVGNFGSHSDVGQ